ncbi:MAG: FxsA family protein [Gemmatimonadota bacterium]|nr:MAG: FxsA family protein [Gemmatimonadota bacterium]
MFRRLILLFILVPIAELALLIQLGRWIGLWPTLGIIVATGVLGATLASREGLRAWRAFQQDVQEGRIPGRPILDGLSIFVGGALLLTPGLATDLLGFALLARPTRRWVQNRVVGRLGGALVRQGQIYVQTSAGWGGSRSGPDSEPAGRPAGREIEPPGSE